MALRANGEKSKVLIVISSMKRHEYERRTPPAPISGPIWAPDGWAI